MATIKICNCCGSELSTYDDFSVNTTAGYGSKYDGLHIAFDLCGDCLDKMLDKMKNEFQISPIQEDNTSYEWQEIKEEMEEALGSHIHVCAAPLKPFNF